MNEQSTFDTLIFGRAITDKIQELSKIIYDQEAVIKNLGRSLDSAYRRISAVDERVDKLEKDICKFSKYQERKVLEREARKLNDPS